MKKEAEYIRIARLIAAQLNGTSTPEEDLFIEAWKKTALRNQKLYDKIRQNIIQAEEFEKYDHIDTTTAYQKFLVDRYAKQKRRYNKLILQRSTQWAAIFILLIGTTYYFYSRQNNLHPNTIRGELATTSHTQTIQPGTSEAILTLSTGEQVTLNKMSNEKLNQHNGIDISLENGKLTYNQNTNEKPLSTEYNTIEIPRGGEYYLELSDGTRLWLNSDTRVRYPMAFIEKDRRIFLERGEIFLEVAKDHKHPFYVECDNSSVRVLGTSFNILSYAGEATQTTLVSGAVEVYSSGNKLKLSPGEQANIDPNGSMTKKQVDVQLYTSWKDGRYYFKSEKLGTILEKISRWYNISVVYTQDELKEKAFSGSFLKYDNFEEVLDILNTTQTIKFKILDNRTIEVSE